MKKNLFKKISIILAVIALVGCAVIGQQYVVNKNIHSESMTQSKEVNITITVEDQTKEIKVEEGLSVMDIMKENYSLQTQYDGTFISGIDDVVADENNFITFNINGEMSMVGAGDYFPVNGDSIEFKLTPLQ